MSGCTACRASSGCLSNAACQSATTVLAFRSSSASVRVAPRDADSIAPKPCKGLVARCLTLSYGRNESADLATFGDGARQTLQLQVQSLDLRPEPLALIVLGCSCLRDGCMNGHVDDVRTQEGIFEHGEDGPVCVLHRHGELVVANLLTLPLKGRATVEEHPPASVAAAARLDASSTLATRHQSGQEILPA